MGCQSKVKTDSSTRSFIMIFFAKIPPNSSHVDICWIGLNDRDVRNTFVWSDKTPNYFSKWHLGEPNGFVERCVEVVGRAGESGWNDLYCARGSLIMFVKLTTCNHFYVHT